MLFIGRLSPVHYHHPLQRDLSLDQATEQDELDISGVGIECIVTAIAIITFSDRVPLIGGH
jgi:hypothetical protein